MAKLSKNIFLTPLQRIKTNGGDVMHAIKNTDGFYKGFGELYFSWVEENFVKGWKLHKEMIMNLIVPYGSVKFVFFDDNTMKFFEVEIGEINYSRLTVMPGIWFGFKGLSEGNNLIVNFANIKHDDDEVEKKTLNEISYNW